MRTTTMLFTDEELRIFEGENLLIFRDWNGRGGKEEIQFTYDLLGGYFISKYLVDKYEESYPYVCNGFKSWRNSQYWF